MGSGASTDKKPLSEVRLKSEVGVLFDDKAKRAFDAAATEGPDGTRVVAWPAIEAYAHDNDERALDPRKCMFHNLKAFKSAREQIAEIARVHIKGAVREIPWVGKSLGDECRQCGPDGAPAKTLEDLYSIAEVAREEYTKVMTAACAHSAAALSVAGLKGKERAAAKASDEYKDKTAPFVSWLFDVVRASVVCETEDAIVHLFRAIEADPNIDIVRVKNRFNPPLFNGYRDILMNVAVKVENVSHLCELQVHLKAIKDSEPMHKSHLTYEFFRSYFLGNAEAVEERLKLLMALPVDEANDVGELVDHVLRDFEDEAPYRANALYWGDDERELAYASDEKLLGGLCELLESIQENAGVVKVREAILAEKAREFGAKSKEAGVALYHLGDAYGVLGENAKSRDACERALPIFEREYGSDHTKVADVLNSLGNAYGDLGDYAKKRDMLERALAIDERTHGRDHKSVAITLGNLGNAYDDLGDYAKARDVLERALAIDERTHGRDHPDVATTLTSLGNACDNLGDHANARDIYERALAIQERACGRDHPDVALTLNNIGDAYGNLDDQVKKREILERALAIFERTYGRDHIEAAPALFNLGDVAIALGDNAKAREYIARALAIAERAYGSDHPRTQMCREKLALVNSPLHFSAKRGDVDAITQLLDDGAEIDQAMEDGATPLYFACENGHLNAARLLLDRGADVHRSNSDDSTPLHIACYNGHIEVVQLLLNNGASADLDREDSDGTPQANAESQGHSSIVALLERMGASPARIVSEWSRTDRAWPPFSEDLVGSSVKVLVDGASLAAEIIEVAEAMAELDGLNGACIRFLDDEHADEEWHEYGTEDILFEGHAAVVDLLAQYTE